MVLSLVLGDEQAKAERRAKALTLYQQVKAWPYWEEVYLNCVKESSLSYEAFEHAVQAGDSSRDAFDRAMRASQMTRAQFAVFLPAFQQFVTLCALYPNVGMLSDGADQVWHAFMLITDRYTTFCEGIIGKPIEHLPCSLYELYGVPQPDARTSCLSSCVPSSCKGNGGGCSKSDLTRSTADSESIAQAIRVSRTAFIQAYQEVFDAPPDHVIWNQLIRYLAKQALSFLKRAVLLMTKTLGIGDTLKGLCHGATPNHGPIYAQEKRRAIVNNPNSCLFGCLWFR